MSCWVADGGWRPAARMRHGVGWHGALSGAVSGGIRCAFPPYAVRAEAALGRSRVDRQGEPFARCLVPTLVGFAAQALKTSPHFSHNYAFVVFDGSDLRADRVGGLGDACGPTKGQAEAVPSFDDVCGGQPSVYALSGSCSGRGVAEANVSEAEFDLVGKG